MSGITKIKTANREEWLALRSKYIGGSDAAAVVGLNPWVSPYRLWAEKTGKIPGFTGNLATEVGTYLEEFVAEKFSSETGKKIRRVNQSFLNSRYPFAIANIDREIVGENAGLEIKTTSELNLKRFKGGEYPKKYYAQCVHYLAVTGKQCWYLAVLIGNREFKWFAIERDEDEIAALMEAEERMWKLIQSNTPPAVDGTQATTDALETTYSGTSDENVDLYPYASVLEQYVSFGKQISELEGMKRECANRIKEYMGEAKSGECDYYRVSWNPSLKRTFNSKQFFKDHPEIEPAGYYRETNTRIFKVSELKREE